MASGSASGAAPTAAARGGARRRRRGGPDVVGEWRLVEVEQVQRHVRTEQRLLRRAVLVRAHGRQRGRAREAEHASVREGFGGGRGEEERLAVVVCNERDEQRRRERDAAHGCAQAEGRLRRRDGRDGARHVLGRGGDAEQRLLGGLRVGGCVGARRCEEHQRDGFLPARPLGDLGRRAEPRHRRLHLLLRPPHDRRGLARAIELDGRAVAASHV